LLCSIRNCIIDNSSPTSADREQVSRHTVVDPSALAPPIWFLALCSAVGVVGLTVLTPILPLIEADLNASSASVQQMFSAYLMAIAVGQLIWGPLSDRYGRRPVLLTGACHR